MLEDFTLKQNSTIEPPSEVAKSVRMFKSKSISPSPLSNGTNSATIGSIFRMAFNNTLNNGINSSIEENETPLSSQSIPSSFGLENDDEKQRKSVRKVIIYDSFNLDRFANVE